MGKIINFTKTPLDMENREPDWPKGLSLIHAPSHPGDIETQSKNY